MDNQWLYQKYNNLHEFGSLQLDVPLYLKDNLNPAFKLRPYQIQAFSRFFNYYTQYPNKEYPIHLLFNMATGSGKTLIMAGLILYLYEQGYRNFLFFVNSTNIIEKTKDNFLNQQSSKYLFNKSITIGNKKTPIQKVDNFERVDIDSINIVFTTIQGLHSDLHTERENALTFEDFKDKKIVLLSDEAHHSNVQTKNRQKDELFEKPNWENTIEKILSKNRENILLEFTATLDFLNPSIEDKYKKKIIYKYDLKQFREDKYSKEVAILQVDVGEEKRIILALVLNQYRQEVAAKHGLNIKPVILFKAQKTIAESKENKEMFHRLIENLSEKKIQEVEKIPIPAIQKAFRFFASQKISHSLLVQKLKINFAENKCISVNEEKEKEEQQILINSLEDKDNQIRAIFAVQKLNEGWDVLNLFDIVRLYTTRDSGKTLGKTTIAEAQLIGRGARYYPFTTGKGQDKYIRKYDQDLEHEMRILEELHYHSVYDSRYISELKEALKEQGLIDDDIVEKQLVLKDTFIKSAFYKSGQIYLNEQIDNTFEMVRSFDDIGVKKRNSTFVLHSGHGKGENVFEEDTTEKVEQKIRSKDISLSEVNPSLIRKALAGNPFFTFSSIQHYFPHVASTAEFISSNKYMSGLSITFTGTQKQLDDIQPVDMLEAVRTLLAEVEKDLRSTTTEKVGSAEFKPQALEKVFYNKILKIDKKSERADGQEGFVFDKPWYAYNANYGTSEEKSFVLILDRLMDRLKKDYTGIYLIRNEQHFKIYNFTDGQPFQPDFVLYMKDKKTEQPLTYQIFIEPKGKHLQATDKWKADFLNEILERFKGKIITFSESRKYRIIGIPFYNVEDENIFVDDFQNAIV